MEWFKHMTSSFDDPDISEAFDEFGDKAYTIFFVTLEVYGREFSSLGKDGELTLTKKTWSRKLRRSWAGVELVWSFYQKRQRFFFTKDDKTATIRIPKFIELSSNWTKRKISKPTEVPTEADIEAPTAKEVEEEVEKKKNTPLPPLPQTMEYPAWLDTELWGKWKEWKREIGQPVSIFEEEVGIQQLKDFKDHGMDIRAVIRQSITNRYKGFFPVRGQTAEKKTDDVGQRVVSGVEQTKKYLNELYAD